MFTGGKKKAPTPYARGHMEGGSMISVPQYLSPQLATLYSGKKESQLLLRPFRLAAIVSFLKASLLELRFADAYYLG